MFVDLPFAVVFVDVHLVGHDLSQIEAQLLRKVQEDDEDVCHLPSVKGALAQFCELLLKLRDHVIAGARGVNHIAPLDDVSSHLADVVLSIDWHDQLSMSVLIGIAALTCSMPRSTSW